MDSIRRTILKTGAAATAVAAAPGVFAQQAEQGGAVRSFYEKGPARIYFEESGSGLPLLLIAGGGLNSNISYFTRTAPFNPFRRSDRQRHTSRQPAPGPRLARSFER